VCEGFDGRVVPIVSLGLSIDAQWHFSVDMLDSYDECLSYGVFQRLFVMSTYPNHVS
jgi:hypothetical protein